MKFWKRSILAQLVIYFSFLSIVTVSIVAIAAYSYARDSLQESVLLRLNVANSLKEFQLKDWINNQRQDVLFVSQLPEIQSQVALLLTTEGNESEKAYSQLDKLVSNIIAVKPNLHSFLITTNGGFVIFSSINRMDVGNFRPLASPTTYFSRYGADSVVPNFYTYAGKAAITFATSILDNEGIKMGALQVNLDLRGVDDLIREKTGLGKSGETYLVGETGDKNVLISGNDKSDFLKEVDSVGIDAAIARNRGQGIYTNYSGVPVIGNYRWLTYQNLALIAEMSQEEAFEPANRLFRDIFLVGVTTSSTLLAATYLISRRITQPILEITDVAIQVASGNLEISVPVLTEDEIGILAITFNEMIRKIKLSNEEIVRYCQPIIDEKNSDISGNLRG